MGAEASKPQPGAELQVIGAGLPRSGTASFCAALSILLDGPVYHGGTQILVNNDDTHIKSWTNILAQTPYKTPAARTRVLQQIKSVTDGFVATADTPLAQFIEELMELYPNAKVICTVRDPDTWAKSMDETSKASLQSCLALMVCFVPVIKHFARYIENVQSGRWGELYSVPGEKWSYGRDVWERHIAYLERTVPKDKLVYLDVRDGWGPLCKALDVPVPKDVEFPRINDGKAIESFARKQVRRGLQRWALLVGGCAFGSLVLWRYILH